MSTVDIEQARSRAVQLQIVLEDGDAIQEIFSRSSGLFIVTSRTIVRFRSPDDLDAARIHPNAPWEQSLHLPHGASDPLVARTIIQTSNLAAVYFGKDSREYAGMVDIAWEVMNSLISLQLIRTRISQQVDAAVATISSDYEAYTVGVSPKPLPIVPYYDIEFRSFANEVRRVLTSIGGLFAILTSKTIENGRFHEARKWAEQTYGFDSLLASMLRADARWIEAWIEVRVAIEHPKADRYVEPLNFALEPGRTVRLPTWSLVHPDYPDMARPQNLNETFETCVDNLLRLFEHLQIVLTDGHLPDWIKVGLEEVGESNRDPLVPVRYRFHVMPQIRD